MNRPKPLPNVIYIVHRLPFPPDKGDRIRAYHLLAWLSRRAEVHLACLADEPVEPQSVTALEQFCRQVAVVPLRQSRWAQAVGSLLRGNSATEGAFREPALEKLLSRWAERTRFDVAIASASSMVPYLRLPSLREIPAVVDLVDVDSQKWLDYAAAERGPRARLYRMEGRRLRRLERSLATWARAVTLVSDEEAALFRSIGYEGPVYPVTNGVDLWYYSPRQVIEERGCVFVGALDYRPNVEGSSWFCRGPWRTILRRRPEETVALVGRRPMAEVRALGGLPGVNLVGQVPDVRPHLAEAAVAIVPLRMARGVQNKVLEAMAMGKAVVASPEALTGLKVEPGVHVLAASTSEQWSDAVVGLLGDADRRHRLGIAARAYVEAHHRWDVSLDAFDPLLGLSYPLAKPTALAACLTSAS